MKRIYSYLLALTCALSALTAQAQVMTIHHKDGTTQEFAVSQLDSVTFDELTLPTLNNQYGVDQEVTDIKSVVMVQDATSGGYEFSLYAESGITDPQDGALLTISLPSSLLGKSIDLASDDFSQVTMQATGVTYQSLEGTLKVSFDKFQTNVTFALESMTETGHYLRTAYTGAFSTSYSAANVYTVEAAGYEAAEYPFATVLRVKPTATGGSTSYAFGDVQATDAEGLKSGTNAVWFTVSAAKLGTTINLATETGSYTFKYIDYSDGSVYEDVTTGTLSATENSNGKVRITLKATLADGTIINGDYYGDVIDVDALDNCIPEKQYGNVILYYNADGDVTVDQEITSAKYKESKDYTYSVTTTTIYFIPDGTNENDPQSCPQLTFTEQLVNAGTLNLVDLADGSLFKIYYKKIQLTSHDDKKYYGYSTYPDNGTVRISRDDNGNYDIVLEVINSYTTSDFSGGTTTGGDNTKIILSYKGAVTAK